MRHARLTGGLRLTAFVAAGALVLHQARYIVGHGGGAGEALARDGHAHMGLALPVTLSTALAVTLATLLVALFARPRRPRAGGRDPRIRALRYALAVLVFFCAQELAEGALSASHPGGLDALFGHGGVAALPLAVALGCLIAVTVDAFGVAEQRLGGALASRRLSTAGPVRRIYAAPDIERLAGLGLVFGFARRPPPSP